MVYQRKTWFNKDKPGITNAKLSLTEKPGITIAKSGFTEKLVISQVKFDKPGFTKLFVCSNLGCKPNAHQFRLKQVKKAFLSKTSTWCFCYVPEKGSISQESKEVKNL